MSRTAHLSVPGVALSQPCSFPGHVQQLLSVLMDTAPRKHGRDDDNEPFEVPATKRRKLAPDNLPSAESAVNLWWTTAARRIWANTIFSNASQTSALDLLDLWRERIREGDGGSQSSWTEWSKAEQDCALAVVEAVKAGHNDLQQARAPLLALYAAMIAAEHKDTPVDVQFESHTRAVEQQGPSTYNPTLAISAWSANYEGPGVNLFHDHIEDCYKKWQADDSMYYAPAFAVANSSGMGKTRVVDESSKTLLTALFVLRDAPDGFPPADTDVLRYLTSFDTQKKCRTGILSFLGGLFTQMSILGTGRDWKNKSYAEVARDFHSHMGNWTQMNESSLTRKAFFAEVLQSAKEQLELNAGNSTESNATANRGEGSSPPGDAPSNSSNRHNALNETATSALTKLLEGLPAASNARLPRLLLAFDEAHTLVREHATTQWSPYSELRRVLRELNSFDHMACFLSTSSSVTKFAPPAPFDPSARVQTRRYMSLPPFTKFPFNMAIVKPEDMTLDAVSRPAFMCSQSRMLFHSWAIMGTGKGEEINLVAFARDKLLGGAIEPDGPSKDQCIAIISRRIPTQIRTSTTASLLNANRQIGRHLRVLLRTDHANELLLTVCPSEPIVSKGAKSAMQGSGLDPLKALTETFGSPGIAVGEQGEMLAELLMVLAADAAAKDGKKFTVLDFFDELLDLSDPKVRAGLMNSLPTHRHSAKENTFETTFTKSMGNFTHFIKVHDDVAKPPLWARYLTRQAAVSLKFGALGADNAIPITLNGQDISEKNTSACFTQTKASLDAKRPNRKVFDKMNPLVLALYAKAAPRPTIRLVFAMKSMEEGFTVMPRDVEDYDTQMLTWDIFVPFSAFKAIKGRESEWAAALDTSLRAGPHQNDAALMGMDPAAGADPAFWPNWDLAGTEVGAKKGDDGEHSDEAEDGRDKGKSEDRQGREDTEGRGTAAQTSAPRHHDGEDSDEAEDGRDKGQKSEDRQDREDTEGRGTTAQTSAPRHDHGLRPRKRRTGSGSRKASHGTK
ncbi:hypothetical protein CALVIDRAFT_568712 [Calocera viscosa TUFC12733]|uniref:Uncharacterized protein n=1 Tax=Calocera viscosa (strain TUFC12733) TaxID=1330018 RepID=A0A167GRL6_CALVF|nr:hypothetical protein CALVIDRAFT_568712 [Calocera viscosa TUFC12733]